MNNAEEILKNFDWGKYPHLKAYSKLVKVPSRDIVGRDKEIRAIRAAFNRPELCNVCLLAPAGSGKTALVQGTMMADLERIYLEVDLAKMIADCQTDVNEMASKIKSLFDETADFVASEGYQIVLFIDEFHQIVQLSAAAVEALKPLLADSGRRGIRVIVATTLEEFNEFISSNQPLVERLLRINVPEPDEQMTVSILKGMAKTYGVDNQFYDDHVFHMIYEYTNRYIPASSQPRKSIKVLDAMIGWHLTEHRPMDDKLLADVIQESEDVNIAFRVDASSIKKRLDEKVLAQNFASEQIARRLQLCVADLNNPDKPMSTMLFTGSTGVGKQVSDDTPVPIIDDSGKAHWKNHGDLQVGDMVVARDGSATRVLGVYPHKDIPMYRVTLTDGRTLDVGDEHLWAVYSAKQRHKIQNEGRSDIKPQILSTVDLVDKGVVRTYAGGSRRHLKWFIPMNEAVQWPELRYAVHPYVVGAFIGNGCLTDQTLMFSSNDVETVNRVAEYLGSPDVLQSKWSYSWKFFLPDDYPYAGPRREYYKTDDLFGDMPELFGVKSAERRIPESYMHGSIEQRWALVRGLFDTDGTVSDDDRCSVSYSTFSTGLAQDVRMLLLSLGVSSIITCSTRTREKADGEEHMLVEYTVHVKASLVDKAKFFDLSRKRDIVDKWSHLDKRQRVKKFDMVGIADIEYIGRQDAKCIYVENDEHLYQVGEFVVTHNTEMTKQLADILFGDQRRLLRFDMTEYANDDSLERFRDLLTTRIWEHPYSIVLLDEIEKACAPVTRLLLQVLDDGRLTNRNNREVSFTNCYIIITTNAGSEIYKTISQYGSSDEGSAKMAKQYDKLIRRSLTQTSEDNKFPPELIGRIDVLVPFQPLSRNTMKAIVEMKLKKLKKTVMDRHGVDVRIDKRVIDYLVEDNLSTDSDSGGARVVVSKLESEVTTEVARFLNENEFVRRIAVKVEGQMAIENKNKLESEAYIKVLAC